MTATPSPDPAPSGRRFGNRLGAGRIPIWVKVGYTLFVLMVVPYYWVTYTPWNFLYFCDIALLVTLVALWAESPFLISTQALGIALAQMLWVVDFLARAVTGVHVTGMTGYMFDSSLPLFVRGLSSFHGWLPFLLVWAVARLGYDRRAFGVQSAVAVVVLVVCYTLAPAPPPDASRPSAAVNINYVYGLDDRHPQTWMAPELWVISLMGFMVVGLYLPAHEGLRRVFAEPEQARRRGQARPPHDDQPRSGSSAGAPTTLRTN